MKRVVAERWKAVAAMIGAVATVLLGVYSEGSTGWIITTCVVAALGVLAVHQVPNQPPAIVLEPRLPERHGE